MADVPAHNEEAQRGALLTRSLVKAKQTKQKRAERARGGGRSQVLRRNTEEKQKQRRGVAAAARRQKGGETFLRRTRGGCTAPAASQAERKDKVRRQDKKEGGSGVRARKMSSAHTDTRTSARMHKTNKTTKKEEAPSHRQLGEKKGGRGGTNELRKYRKCSRSQTTTTNANATQRGGELHEGSPSGTNPLASTQYHTRTRSRAHEHTNTPEIKRKVKTTRKSGTSADTSRTQEAKRRAALAVESSAARGCGESDAATRRRVEGAREGGNGEDRRWSFPRGGGGYHK